MRLCLFGFIGFCGGGGAYSIQIDFNGVPILSQGAFSTASSKWSSAITGDVQDISGSQLDPGFISCNGFPAIIDDLYICASVGNLGPGILGSAGPLYARGDNTAVAGVMIFDTSALGRGDFDDIIVSRLLAKGCVTVLICKIHA